jgi:hypothetical protein
MILQIVFDEIQKKVISKSLLPQLLSQLKWEPSARIGISSLF